MFAGERAVEHQQHAARVLCEFAAAAHAFKFDAVFAVIAQPGGVHKAHGQSRQSGLFFQIVARGARLFRDYGALAAEKGVHEARLARIHPAGQHHERAFAPAAGPFISGKQRADARGHFVGNGGELLRRQAFPLFVGKVDGEADALPQIFESFPQRLHPAAEKAVQLGRSEVHPLARGRGNDFCHGFGLREIHAPVQKGAPGELSAFGHARAARKHGVEQRGQHGRAAVTLNFGAVFAGEGMRSRKEHHECVVRFAALGVEHVTVMQHARREVPEAFARRTEHGAQNVVRLRAGYAYDAYPAGSGSRGHGRYGVRRLEMSAGAHLSSSALIMEASAGSSQMRAAIS